MIIENFKPVYKGIILATFNLKVPKWGNFVIRGLTLWEKNGARWFSFPSQSFNNQAGEKKYAPHCLFEDKDMHIKFQELVMAAIKDFLDKNPSMRQAPVHKETQAMPQVPDQEGVPF